jgi:hypothetical protein
VEFRTVTYQRAARYKVDGRAALALRQQGHSLPEIQKALGTDASLPTISRAIARVKGAQDELPASR